MKTTSLLQFGISLTALIILAGCGGGGDSRSSGLPDPEIRFLNITLPPVGSTPGTDPGLDIVLSSQNNPEAVRRNGILFGEMSPNFQEIDFIEESDGAYDTSIRKSGQIGEFDREYSPFQKNTDTLIMGMGLQDSGGENRKRARVLFVQIDRKAPTGNCRIYFLNAFLRSPGLDTPSVTLQNIDLGDPNSIENPSFKIQNVEYAALKSESLPPGPLTLIVRRNFDAGSGALVEYARTNFNFEAGKVYFAVITGQEANPIAAWQPSIKIYEMPTQN